MADLTKKRKPSGSFARRILIVSILLLVIPLFLQTLFLYRREYKEKLQDVEADLRVLANERAHFINEKIEMDWLWLKRSGATSVNSRDVKELYIEKIPLPEGAGKQFVGYSRSKEALLVGVAESNENALVIAIPFTEIAKDLPRAYSVRMALVAQDEILWENSKAIGRDVLEVADPIGQTGIKVQLSINKDQIKELHLQSYYFRFASLLVFVGVLGGGAVFLFTRRIAKPFRHLWKIMERVKEGGVHVRYKRDWMGFEINELGEQFNETLDGLLHHSAEAEKERIHREKLANELHIGHEIQAGLLPKNISGWPGIDIASCYLAAKEVNGDYYDLFKMSNGNLLIAICDTAGKGISACLFALGLRSIIRALANVETDLSEIVRKANDLYLLDAHESSMFATLWIGVYDPKLKKLTYCSQGHPPAILLRGAQLEELWSAGIALGAQNLDVVPIKEIHLEKGDLLILYTDGILEAHDSTDQLFGKKRFYDIAIQKQKTSARQIANRIIEEVELFARGAPQHDDITLLVIRIEDKK